MKKLMTTTLAFVLVLFLAVPPSVIHADDADPSLSSQAQQEQDADNLAGQAEGDETVPQPEGTDETEEVVPTDDGAAGATGTSSATDEPGQLTDEDASDLTAQAVTNPYPTPLPEGRYRIRPSFSNARMLEIDKGSTASSANLQINRSNNELNQFFDVSYDDNGLYTIMNAKSKKVLDISGGQAKRGANVIQFAPHGGNNQKWIITESRDAQGKSVYTIASALSKDIMLDVSGSVDANLTNVHVWPKNNASNQKFYFMPLDPGVVSTKTVDDGIYTITSALSDKFALDIARAGTANGIPLELWTYHGGLAQLFRIEHQSDGFYIIRSLGSGKVLDVSGSDVISSTPVSQWNSHGGDNQRWAIVANGDGTFSFIAKVSGLVLDVSGSKAASGTELLTFYPHNGKNQRFKLKPAMAEPLQEGIFALSPFSDLSKSVDIAGSSLSSGAEALTFKSHGGMNQKFQITRTDVATYAFSSLISGMYLADDGGVVHQTAGSGGKPTAAQQWVATWTIGGIRLVNVSTKQAMVMGSDGRAIKTVAPSSAASQAFRFQEASPVNPGYYVIKSATGFALDLDGGNVARGTNVQFLKPNNSAAQIWKLELGSGGYYTISNARSGKYLDISGGGTAEGTNVMAWDKNGAANQKWKPVPSGDGWFYLRSANGTWLSVSGAGDYDRANVFVSTTNTKKAQKFRFTASTYTGYVGTYADVNLTTQKMIYVKDGVLVLESDVVTGAPSMKTPTGTFKITRKLSPTVLVGPGYAQPVTYWMQFTSNGVGFHDATWQSSFGGNRYISHGSHGCVNMPMAAAKELYSVISIGDTVKVHY